MQHELGQVVDSAIGGADPRWLMVRHVIESGTFQKAHRLRMFFLHVCRCGLENRPEEATEQQIGIQVFGRPPGYNPSEDNIVRSQARLLRLKLEHYFANEGQQEPFRITIPKGQYLPVFEECPTPAAEPEPAPVTRPVPVQPQAVARQPRLLVVFVTLTVLLAGATVWLAILWLRSTGSSATLSPFEAMWGALLPADSSTLIIASDHTYGLLQEAERHDIPLGVYLSSQYGDQTDRLLNDSGLGKIFANFGQLHLTGFYNVTDALRLAALAQFKNAHVTVRFARDVTSRDLYSGSLILIGSRHTNPWMELFDPKLNFGYEYDYQRMDNYCVNRSPRPGEQPFYRPKSQASETVAYGGLALLSGLRAGERVLNITGTSMAGAEMAGEFITNPLLCAKFLDRISAGAHHGGPPNFEVLLRTASVEGQPAGQPEIVAYRTLADNSPTEEPGK